MYEEIEPIPVLTVKEDVVLQAVDRGTIIMHFKVGRKTYEVPIYNVLHIPQLTFNLVSLSKLDDKHVKFESEDGECCLSY